MDTVAGTVKALGLTIVVDAATRKEDKESHDQFFALGDLRSGDWIDVRGYPDPAGSGKIIATRLEREDRQDTTELRGRAESLAAPRFKIAGVNIETIPATTKFEDGEQDIDSATFFARASGLVVDVRGAWNGTLLTAAKAEIESDEDGAVAPPVSPPPVTPPPVTPPPGTGNRAPVANAGAAKTVASGAAVALDGSASSDPDGDALTFSWTLQRPATSAAALTGATTSKPGFVARRRGIVCRNPDRQRWQGDRERERHDYRAGVGADAASRHRWRGALLGQVLGLPWSDQRDPADAGLEPYRYGHPARHRR